MGTLLGIGFIAVIIFSIGYWIVIGLRRANKRFGWNVRKKLAAVSWWKVVLLLLAAVAVAAFAAKQLAAWDEWQTKKWCSEVLVGGNDHDKEYCRSLLRFYQNE